MVKDTKVLEIRAEISGEDFESLLVWMDRETEDVTVGDREEDVDIISVELRPGRDFIRSESGQ